MPECDNCAEEKPTVDRVAVFTNTHTGEQEGRAVELCETCADAFDLGAGNA